MISKEKRTYLAVGSIFLLITTMHHLGWLTPVETKLQNLTTPFIGQINGLNVQVGENYQFFKNRSDFIAAYQACVSKNEDNDVREAQIKLLQQQNDELQKQLGYFQKKPTVHLTAQVIGKELLSTDQTVMVDKGRKDGVKMRDPVIAGSGIIIGKVAKVDESISIVRLLNDNQSRIGAAILNNDKSIGVVEGGFGISLKMNLIPRDESVIVGDQIVTSGLETDIPRGLLIGSVSAVENEPYQPFQNAVVTPATDLSKISDVSILLTN